MAKKTRPVTALTADRRPLLVAVLVFAVAGATWFLLASPARLDADLARAEVAQATGTLTANESRLADLRSGKQRSAAALLDRARQLDALLPSAADRVALVSRVDTVARSSGVTLTLMNPVEDKKTGSLLGSQFDVSVSGSQTAVTAFLSRVSDTEPLMTMHNVSIKSASADGTGGEVTASLRLQVWSTASPDLPTRTGTATTTPGTTPAPPGTAPVTPDPAAPAAPGQ